MTWNYRVMAIEQNFSGIESSVYLEIRTVYYDEEGKPTSYGDRGHAIGGDDIAEIQEEFNLQQLALTSPILWTGDKWPQEYKLEAHEQQKD